MKRKTIEARKAVRSVIGLLAVAWIGLAAAGCGIKLTYEDNGKLYIARGYGEKETGGYSISVKDVYLTQNALCFVTTLIGPGENETVAKAPSFPYIVVEVTKCDKNVLFE